MGAMDATTTTTTTIDARAFASDARALDAALDAIARGLPSARARATHAVCRATDSLDASTRARVEEVALECLAATSRVSDDDSGASTRVSGARMFHALGDAGRGGVGTLAALTRRDGAARVRAACARALGEVGGSNACVIRALGSALGDARDEVRIAATRACEARGAEAKTVVGKLAANATSDDPELRQATCEAIESVWRGRRGDPAPDGSEDVILFQSAECAGELTRDADAGVRAAATRCLGHLRGAAAAKVSLINKRIEDTDESVREAATEALIKLGFFNPSTGTLSKTGNYRTTKFSANKNLFAVLSGKQDIAAVRTRVKVPIGAVVRVWWPMDEAYYEAKVKAYDKETREHTVLYVDDGVEERVNFKKEKVDLRHKPSKKGPTTWIPCGMLPKKSKETKSESADKERARSERKRKREGDWIDYEGAGAEVQGVGLVGRHVKVWWPLDKAWYTAEVRGYDDGTREHVVFYFEDSEEEKLQLANERVQVFFPSEDATVPSVHGLEPKRLAVRVGKKNGMYEPGCFRGAECVSCVDEKGEPGTYLCADFDKRFGDPQTDTRRWRRSILVVPAPRSKDAPQSIDKWLRAQGDRWGAHVVGKELKMDINVDMRDFPADKGDVKPIWQRVKIIAYSSTSGEHQVVDVKEDGTTDPTRIHWLPLCMQRTAPDDGDDDGDDDDDDDDA